MLSKVDETSENTYGFEFQNPTKLDEIATIKVIGVEHRETKRNYFWD